MNGIRVTLVEPGRFRTDFAGRSLDMPSAVGEDYRPMTSDYAERVAQMHGTQDGDPARAARAMIAVVAADDPPLRLALGPDAWEMAHEKIARLQRDLEAWKSVTLGTDFQA